MSATAEAAVANEWEQGNKRSWLLYVAVACVAGAVIALQIAIMRIFAVGSWAHFGSLVVSLAMLGFGLTSAIMCVAKPWFERNWRGVIAASLCSFGPLVVAANLGAQQLPFNAIFLLSDPVQKWHLFDNFVLYLLPFLCGSFFLGTVFLRAQSVFGRVYFADLAGSGFCGLLFLGTLFFLRPENLVVMPIILAAAGSLLWFVGLRDFRTGLVAVVLSLMAVAAHFVLPEQLHIARLAVSDYKGVSYARKFPDNQRVYERASPFGYMEIYSSSYLHFAPGLSDNAALNLPEMPANAYLGMYVDSDGPSGIIRNLSDDQTKYFHYLPMIYPYLIKSAPETFVVQFGGGISTAVALHSGARRVTVGESNPAVLDAFRHDEGLRKFTGDVLYNPKVRVVDYEGRLYLAHTQERFDIVDLSLADSAGLSSPGGFAIVEKYAYTQEAMQSYMRALNDNGVLAVTLWNKEEPPKSILKLYATMVAAARANGEKNIADSFYVVSSYLSTTTVLFQRGGFLPETLEKLHKHSDSMSFDEIYYPGMAFDADKVSHVLDDYQVQIFAAPTSVTPQDDKAVTADSEGVVSFPEESPGSEQNVVPATALARLAWHALMQDTWPTFADRYVFDARPLTNARPYFAAYVRPGDLPRIMDRLELLQDEWGYLLLWATLAIACMAGLVLISMPVLFQWRAAFQRYPGKALTILFFACLGLGYITVEVGMIAHFMLALGNATVSASVLITGMLVFSGLGSFISERYLDRARTVLPKILLAISVLLATYGFATDRILDLIGSLPYGWRLVCCFILIAPPAFLMGFPMATAMTTLSRLGKDHMFLWAWGVNGCFSVIGAAMVPIIATSFGLTSVLLTASAAYFLAIPAFFAVLRPVSNPVHLQEI
ncbi:MAG TPA: hypothetical protein PLF22_00635 [Pseudomonadales bacterium]|nr:hypothetical protein [Pseudomonadales bacterium]